MTIAELAGPTPERRRRSHFIAGPAVATDAGPARAGQRVYRSLSTLERLVRSGALEPRHAIAGERLRDDWELGVEGAREPASGSTAAAGWYYPDARLAALRRCENALSAIGPAATYVLSVAVCECSITDVAKFHHCHRQKVTSILKISLHTLAEHYLLPK